MAQVKCADCGWEGNLDELEVKYHLNPHKLGDVIPEGICPECGNFNLEDIDGVSKEIPV